ncbi:MAG: PAS domain S-box protein [Bacteroidetes bacterium]|nr:PAS domain S-box protein [Bacteroidota bacterium]
MKSSFKNKITAGYIANIVVVLAIAFIYWKLSLAANTNVWNWIALGLIILSLGMLTTVYFILIAQLKAKNKSQISLLETQKLLQSIINNTSNPISVKKINGEYILINKQYEALFKLKAEDIKGKTDHDFLPKEIADSYRNSDLEAIKANKEIQIEEIIEQTDGPHTYLAVKFPLFDISNRIYSIGTIATDISEIKSANEALIAGNTFFNLSKDMLIIASENNFVKINPALSKVLGYSNNELLNNTFYNYIFPEDIDITKEKIKNLEAETSLENFKNRWVCKDGTVKWLSWTATLDKPTGLLYAIAHDITEQLKLEIEEKEAINNLFENEQKLNMILENISDGVLVANTSKQVVLANYMANELFQIEDDSKISIHFSDHFNLYYPDEKTTFPLQNLPMERALIGESTDDIDVLLLNPVTKEKKNVLLSGRPIINSENQIIAAVVTIKDITKYKKIKKKLKKTALKYRRLIGFNKDNEEI